MKHDEYADISFVLRSPLSQKILKCLRDSEKPLTPKQISKRVDIATSNVSTKFKGLRDRKLVECINPDDRKWRFYKITDTGKRILEGAKKAKEV